MSRRGDKTLERGFTLIELLTASWVFFCWFAAQRSLSWVHRNSSIRLSRIADFVPRSENSGWTRSMPRRQRLRLSTPEPTTTAISSLCQFAFCLESHRLPRVSLPDRDHCTIPGDFDMIVENES